MCQVVFSSLVISAAMKSKFYVLVLVFSYLTVLAAFEDELTLDEDILEALDTSYRPEYTILKGMFEGCN